MNVSHFRAAYLQELERLGLDEDTSPYAGMATASDEAAEEFLAHVRALPRGATWRDVFPDIPDDWDLEDPDSWRYPYHPIASYDYPAEPAGPVIMVSLPLDAADSALDELMARARAEGFQLYGAGFVPIQNPDWPDRPVRIVMDWTTTEAQCFAFNDWLEAQPDATFHGVSRYVHEPRSAES